MIPPRARGSTGARRARLALALAAFVTLCLAPAARADTVTFEALRRISLPSFGAGTPYPSTIRVHGVSGTPSSVAARVNGLGPELSLLDLDILLVGPGGADVMLLSDVCSHSYVGGADYVFEDNAPTQLPANDLNPDACDPTNFGGATYRPSNSPPGETMPAPAPGPPYGTALDPLALPSPLGAWGLFAQDDYPDNSHYRIGRGWELRLRGVRSRLRCAGRRATIIGSSAPETLIGTPGADVIVGLGGPDVIRGFGGNDRICGGKGRDRLLGGGGADRLLGGGGPDRLFGGPGRDRLLGGPRQDRLNGGKGKADLCRGGPGRDKRRGCERGRG